MLALLLLLRSFTGAKEIDYELSSSSVEETFSPSRNKS